jgi:hypothetical protein
MTKSIHVHWSIIKNWAYQPYIYTLSLLGRTAVDAAEKEEAEKEAEKEAEEEEGVTSS